MKIYKFFVKRNEKCVRKFVYLAVAQRYFLKHKDHRTRSHFRIEDRIGNVIMSNRLITAA